MQIIPGVLEKDWNNIEQKLELISSFANSVHIDIIDGEFVNNKTFLDPAPFKNYSGKLFMELHMMVVDPESYIEKWAHVGVRRFLGHVEHMTSQPSFIKTAKKYGEAGFALDGPTHISAIKVPFQDLNSILVYTSHRVGFSGPPLMDDRLDKVKHLKKLTSVPIEVDGGINDKSILKAKEAGATRFIATSFITGSQNPKEQFNKLNELIR